jgi:outer membrane protein assembly factor BamB
MTTSSNETPLRVWPAVAIAVTQVALYFLSPLLAEDAMLVAMAALMGGALLTLLWWLFFSRAAWLERIGALVLMALAVLVARQAVDPSIGGAGQGMLMYILSVPLMMVALTLWAVTTRNLPDVTRRVALVAAVALGCTPLLVTRTAGIRGGSFGEFHWRWTPTPEARLLAEVRDEPAPPADLVATTTNQAVATSTAPATITPAPVAPAASSEPTARVTAVPPAVAEWPGFRGPLRDGVIRNVRINPDWAAAPPAELWRRPIGPGWSSFAVRGDLLYTQEQRGEDEVVSCYRVSTGAPVWRHRDRVRFWESNGGAGPRATPTISGDRVYAFGATGILNALDALTGKKIWSADVGADTKRAVPFWGFAASPLVVDDIVIIAAAATLAGYDAASGTLKWKGPSYGGSYSSPHLVTLDGVSQVVQLGGPGAISVAPADGSVLWEHKWEPGPMVQPAITDDGDILINNVTATGGVATRRLHVTKGSNGWNLEERWTSAALKPNFNDFVLHKGHAYGFDNNILASLNLETGERNWKGGRYGNGQMVLLKDQDLLLVTSEDGELALVPATPDKYTEIAKMRIFEGKTWNHPVIVRGLLLVRNGEEMAAFKLPLMNDNRISVHP